MTIQGGLLTFGAGRQLERQRQKRRASEHQKKYGLPQGRQISYGNTSSPTSQRSFSDWPTTSGTERTNQPSIDTAVFSQRALEGSPEPMETQKTPILPKPEKRKASVDDAELEELKVQAKKQKRSGSTAEKIEANKKIEQARQKLKELGIELEK